MNGVRVKADKPGKYGDIDNFNLGNKHLSDFAYSVSGLRITPGTAMAKIINKEILWQLKDTERILKNAVLADIGKDILKL